MKELHKCVKCNSYNLKEICSQCGSEALTIRPPKYSPDDKYAEYRRKAKLQLYQERGLL